MTEVELLQQIADNQGQLLQVLTCVLQKMAYLAGILLAAIMANTWKQ